MTALPGARRLAALTVIAVIAAGCAGEPRRVGPLDQRAAGRLAAVQIEPAAAGRILNAYRSSRGLGPIRLDPALTAMAQTQANAMIAGNALSHEVGGSFTARVHAAGLDSARVAENLGGGSYSTQEVFYGWRQSPGHDTNLLMKEASRFGIALAKDPSTTYRTYWALVIAAEPERRQEISAGPVGYFGSNIAVPR